jgi:hypothetical protein
MAFLSSTVKDLKNSPHDAQKQIDRSSGNRGGFYLRFLEALVHCLLHEAFPHWLLGLKTLDSNLLILWVAFQDS